MADQKLTESEAKLAKRAGKGGRAFVLARRKTPGLTLLEFEASQDAELADALGVTSTTADPSLPEPTRVTSPAKKSTTRKA